MGETLSPAALPPLTFVVAAIIAVSTGSAWGTMAILYPILSPVAYQISIKNNFPDLYYATMAQILSGAVMGDHCSIISDTTVISAMACGCTVVSHTWSQIPYSLLSAFWSVTVGAVSVGARTLPVGGAVPLTILCAVISAHLLSVPTDDMSAQEKFERVLSILPFYTPAPPFTDKSQVSSWAYAKDDKQVAASTPPAAEGNKDVEE